MVEPADPRRGQAAPGLADALARTRYSRHLLLPEIGSSGQGRLAAARVLVVGAGGLGSPTLLYLAAAGVGTIGIVDDDTVDLSNLQRQIVHTTAGVGASKVASAAEAVARLNPSVRVEAHPQRLTAETADALVAAYDLVVDGADNFATRYAVNDACVRAGVPLVWASVLRFDAQVAVWWAGHGPCLRCVFPDEPPADAVPSCAEAGVLGALCGAVGSVQATEAIKLILDIGEPLIGRVLVHDGLRQSWDSLAVQADPRCRACGIPDDADAAATVGGAEPVAPPPGPVPTVDARTLARELRSPHPPVLVDVRSAPERAIVTIPDDRWVELGTLRAGAAWTPELLGPQDAPIVFYCKTGARSAEATRLALAAGWRYAANLEGGVLAWVDAIDPRLASY